MDARLSLSTATPSIGGSAPKLETARLHLIPNAYPRGRTSSIKAKSRQSYGFGEESRTIEAAQAQVSEGLSSSVFDIATLATIPSDNTGHKVQAVLTVTVVVCFHYIFFPNTFHAWGRALCVRWT